MQKIKLFSPILLLLLTIVGSITFFFTWVNLGFSSQFLSEWFTSLVIGLFVFSPLGMLSTLLITKLVSLFLKKDSLPKKILIGALIGCTMEFFISFIVVTINFGFTPSFINQWLSAFLKSVPIGICLGLLISFLIKPWIFNRIQTFKENKQVA
ncbi:DUF2798 domain-containing protein [Mesonia aestuariivivens]|uniref:DUF2798 domain-containing protein n=1 Tax=Mesonia aestuariivivens TaxID=2796128 RepID=A0ABS6W564_9FLAO|nr:DUF2798 domain-containing protein [Mesonia aestuariivivens]MBW2963008.1 DUF2798 domain-containing protein [Mesonia aestuariivivens]